MPTELILALGATLVGAVLLIGALAWPRHARPESAEEQREGRHAGRDDPRRRRAGPFGTALAESGDGEPESGVVLSVDRAVRITWWVTIAAVLVGVGLSGAFPETQTQIFAVGGVGALVVLVLHELLPATRARRTRAWLEALVAIGLVTAVVALSGYGASPFFFAYALVTVAVALTRSAPAVAAVSVLASLAYVLVVALDPQRPSFTGLDYLRFALNVGSIWLLAFLGAMFAAHARRERRAIEEVSVSDHLTGLYNRSQILPSIDREIRRTRRSERGFCVLMIDLDGLKAVNDSLGHHRGDNVLRQLASIISRSIRTVDSAFRYGGDEFLVLLPETDIVGAFVVAEKIRAGAEEVGTMHGEGVETSVSIGLVSHPEDGLTVEELMVAADRAMYLAKSSGKNQIAGAPRVRRSLQALGSPTALGIPAAQSVPVAPARLPTAPPSAAVTDAPPPSTPTDAARPSTPTDAAMPPADQAPAATVPAEDRPVGTEEASTSAPAPAGIRGPNGRHVAGDDEEPDPAVVRRQIASASRSFDPDEQVRRAMDAFLSPRPPRDR